MLIFKRISSFLLATLVLLSSMGFFVEHMVCGMSGEHKLAINKSITSCGDTCNDSDRESINNSCCDYESNYFQEDVPVNPTDKTQKQEYSSFRFIAVETYFQDDDLTNRVCFSIENDIPSPPVKRYVLLESFLI